MLSLVEVGIGLLLIAIEIGIVVFVGCYLLILILVLGLGRMLLLVCLRRGRQASRLRCRPFWCCRVASIGILVGIDRAMVLSMVLVVCGMYNERQSCGNT